MAKNSCKCKTSSPWAVQLSWLENDCSHPLLGGFWSIVSSKIEHTDQVFGVP